MPSLTRAFPQPPIRQPHPAAPVRMQSPRQGHATRPLGLVADGTAASALFRGTASDPNPPRNVLVASCRDAARRQE
jgi:hypothetical protein